MVDYKITTFLTLYERMNYRETAQKLNMTQPAVTQHIQALEKEYGCRLFVYDRRKLYRTPKADQLAHYSRSLLYNERVFRQMLHAEQPRVLRVGATKTIGEFVIGDQVERFLEDSNNNLCLRVDNTERLLDGLEKGELDFAMVEGSFDKQKYACRLFRKEPFVGICAATHPFAGKEVALEDVFDNTVIVREEGSGTRAILERLLDDFGYRLDCFSRSVCISNFAMIRRLVADDKGISFAYSSVALDEPRIQTFRIRNLPLLHEFHYVYLQNTQADLLVAKFDPAVNTDEP